MKKTLAAFVIFSALALQGCVVGVSSVQPPHARYYGHPSLVVIPGTYVYAMTDVTDDIYFHVGWWWRLWDGRWYKSRHYDRGWSHYRGVPGFYREVDPRWRDFYRHRSWHGHPWTCERIPAPRVQSDWHRWQDTRHWEREKNWGVKGFRPEPYRHAGLAEQERDGSRFREADRHRQVRAQASPERRPEFTREKETTEPGLPFFGNRRTHDREAQHLERNRSRESRNSRPQQGFERQRQAFGTTEARRSERHEERHDMGERKPTLEHQERNDEKIESPQNRQSRERQGSRRNRPFSDQGQREPGATGQPRQEQFRQGLAEGTATPLFQERHREARSERRHQDASDLRQSRPTSRQREIGQERPQHRERSRVERNRPAQERPGQKVGNPDASSGEAPETTQPQ